MGMESSRWTHLASTSHCILQSSYFNWTYQYLAQKRQLEALKAYVIEAVVSQLRGQPCLTSSSPVSALWSCTSRCHQLTSWRRHCRTRHLACKGRRSPAQVFHLLGCRNKAIEARNSSASWALTFSLCSFRGLGTRCNSLARWKGWWADAWRRTRSRLPPLGGRGKPNPSP